MPKKQAEQAPKPEKQKRLPTMEDPAIEELEQAALAYAKIRDRRMALTPQEVELNKNVINLMKKHGKSTYTHRGITITLTVEKEKAKVRVKDEDDE